LLCLGVHLQLTPINYAKIFLALLVHVHPVHPMPTPVVNIIIITSECVGAATCSGEFGWGQIYSRGILNLYRWP